MRRATRTLIVEDDRDAAAALALALEARGHDVVVTRDAVSGLGAAYDHAPDVALIDIGLPRKNGNALAAEIRWELGDRIRLIAITGDAAPEARARALSAGFDDLLVKPVAIDDVEAAIAQSRSR